MVKGREHLGYFWASEDSKWKGKMGNVQGHFAEVIDCYWIAYANKRG